jgi:acetylornithine deacetylase/succinyl-diaminopimelate desuccinylase-like protein
MLSQEEKQYALKKYIEFLQHPSVSATGEGIRDTASWLKDFMTELGIDSTIEDTGGHPVVLGKVNNGGDKTLLVYNHYDVQPVDPLNEWKYPPFSATIENDVVYARGASDNKGVLIARLIAFSKYKGNLNFKFLFEGEEEIGSVHLSEYVEEHKEKLNADAVIMEGAGLDTKGRPMIILGVKGLLYVQLTVRTGDRDVHSSNAPIVFNPVWELIKILNSIYDGEKVKLKGFYDDIEPINAEIKELLEKYDVDPEDIRKSLGVFKLKTSDIKSLLTEPTCNIDGIISGYTGKGSKTIVPSYAMVKMDFRLVPNQDPKKILSSLIDLIKDKAEIEVMGMEKPVRTSPNSNVVKAMVNSAKRVYLNDPVIIPNSAGTQPMGVFADLGIKEIVSAIGVGTPSSNAHAPNENVKLENFYKAIEHAYEFYNEYEKLNK